MRTGTGGAEIGLGLGRALAVVGLDTWAGGVGELDSSYAVGSIGAVEAWAMGLGRGLGMA